MSGLRIIGGQHRGKRLASPPDRTVRPTAERAREALFNILDHAGLIAGEHVLDLFCGTGAVGLEAYSRGAAEVWLIDRDISLAAANLQALGRPSTAHARRMDATALGRPPCRFGVVFMDPPYRSGLVAQVLTTLSQGWLAKNALIVVELSAKEKFDLPSGFEQEQDRQYGAARLVFLRSTKDVALGSS